MTAWTPESGAAAPPVLSVSQATALIKQTLEATFDDLWVAGEIGDFSRPRSGHCYFSLKDDGAQLRAVIWKGVASRIPFEPRDGMEVVVHGRIDVYPPRGGYQLIVDSIEPQGVGALELALRQLKEKLAKEGLFASERKRPLPRFPRRVAIVTSPTGAAVRDFLEVFRRRGSGVSVLVVPAKVQGPGAAKEIASAIAMVNRIAPPLDVLVVGRGGGSLEDLWCFNEEPVVRAIAASQVPVMSAVGHEIDVTLADLVADVRAATPSEAAERLAPAATEMLAALQGVRQRMNAALRGRAERLRNDLMLRSQARPFRRPFDALRDRARVLDEWEGRAQRSIAALLRSAREATAQRGVQLQSLSPLAVLDRGYTLTETTDGAVVSSVGGVSVGDEISTRLADGRLLSKVLRIDAAASDAGGDVKRRGE